MARGKIVTDPVEYLERRIEKLKREYNGSPSTVQREHLQDKIFIYEQCLFGLSCKTELDEYRQLDMRCRMKTGKSLGEVVNG